MLEELTIRDFAIIDDLTIRFEDGLTILSGETGAGKSIIINAVNLLLGSRASSGLIRSGAEAAELEALFRLSPQSPVARELAESGFDASDGLLIRRVVSQNERHRVYVNGRLSTLAVLAPIARHLASISGQHAHQRLLQEDQHLVLLDQFGGLTALRRQVADAYHQLLPLIRRLEELKGMKRLQAERLDLYRFQLNEIESAALQPDEDSVLELERMRLKHAAALYETVFSGIEALYGEQGAVAERLGEVRKRLEAAAHIDPDLTRHAKGVADAAYLVEDTAADLRAYLKGVQVDEMRLEEVEARLDVLSRLKRKYGGSLAAVTAEGRTLRSRLEEVQDLDHRIAAAADDIAACHRRLSGLAADLSARRQRAAGGFAREVEGELASLKMEQTRFEVRLERLPADGRSEEHLMVDGAALTESGIDRASFLIAPNVGEVLRPMVAIASGGELSRVVLALKAILSGTDEVETIVFDEVDAGIGGGVAEVVGRKLASLARRHQVLCITHLPQIAKFGDHHFRIAKSVAGGRTRTRIDAVRDEERVEEIARMLAGVEITEATRQHARELLRQSPLTNC